MKVAKLPDIIPKGIPIKPKIVASYKTFFLICFLVAPILFNIPYCFVFSDMDISKLFLIQNTEVIIIIIHTINTTIPNPPIELSLMGLVSNIIKYSFTSISYFAFDISSIALSNFSFPKAYPLKVFTYSNASGLTSKILAVTSY